MWALSVAPGYSTGLTLTIVHVNPTLSITLHHNLLLPIGQCVHTHFQGYRYHTSAVKF